MKEKKATKEKEEKKVNTIVKNPRVTEKASFAIEQNIYTFDVATNANKIQIKKAIFDLYKVKPTQINMVKIQDKKTFTRGMKGIKRGGKKALVHLKKGDKIEL
ncbi:MAG: 50S ribosomal protein L23 [bacterium]|nr:50S ribosomal protein L23 [bacterium]